MGNHRLLRTLGKLRRLTPLGLPLAALGAVLLAGGAGGARVSAAAPPPAVSLAQLPFRFVENQGQAPSHVRAYSLNSRHGIFFEESAVTFAVQLPAAGEQKPTRKRGRLAGGPADLNFPETSTLPPARQHQVRVTFPGARPGVAPVLEDPTPTTVGYFHGAPDEWQTNLPLHRRVVYRDLWPGIDLVFRADGERLKQEFLVRPGADAGQLRQSYTGATGLRLTDNGDLEILTGEGRLLDERPYSYQEIEGRRLAVASEFVIERHGGSAPVARLAVGDYDRDRHLVVDPAFFVYCGFLGGSASEDGHDITVAVENGVPFVYIVGETRSTEATFPIKNPGGLGDKHQTPTQPDIFVAKLVANPTDPVVENNLVFCGFLGGTSADVANGVAVDAENTIHITGFTTSTENTRFPLRGNLDRTHNGVADVFLIQLAQAAGNVSLVNSGYIGGDRNDMAQAIALDPAGNAYLVGQTLSANFPVQGGPELTREGFSDAFVVKVDKRLSSITYAGYLGGRENEVALDVAVDAGGHAYVCGQEFDDPGQVGGFPVTVGPSLVPRSGRADGFVAKVSPGGDRLVYCGYLSPSTQVNTATGIAVDRDGHAYVTGGATGHETLGPPSPLRVGPRLDITSGVPGFLAKVNPAGTGFVYFGLLHDSGQGQDVAVDDAGRAYVVGGTGSFLPEVGGPDLSHGGGPDSTLDNIPGSEAFIATVIPNPAHPRLEQNIVYASYLGGAEDEAARGVALDRNGNAYIVGVTKSTQATMTIVGGPDRTHNGDQDVFVAKIAQSSPTAAEVRQLTAHPTREGTLLHWRTSGELDHLGTHLWAERSDGQRQRLTSDLLTGSALLAGPGTPVAGAGYTWLDREPARAYWFEMVDLQGRHEFHGPVRPTPAPPLPPADAQVALTLAELGDSRTAPPTGEGLRRWAPSSATGTAGIAALPSRPRPEAPAVGLEVREEGWYQVTQPDLVAAGLDPGADPRSFRLVAGGQPVGLRVLGAEDGRFDPQDRVEFYGLGLETPWTGQRTYFLEWGRTASTGGSATGIGQIPRGKDDFRGTPLASFPDAVERQDRVLHFPALKNGDASNLFGPVIGAGWETDQSLNIPHLAPGPGLLEVALQGVTDPPGEGDHRVTVRLNGTPLGEVRFEGREPGVAAFPVASGQLHNGLNRITLEAAGATDVCVVDTVRVQFPRRFVADGEQLRAVVPGGSLFRLEGFGGAGACVLDCTDPHRPVEVQVRTLPGGTAVVGRMPGGRGRRVLVAFGPEGVRSPAGVRPRAATRWSARNQQADLVILGPAVFLPAAEPLAAARRAEGLRVALIPVEQLYDELSFGEKSPHALRRFLTETVRGWTQAPRYALLLGDASLDPRGELGLGVTDFVPTRPLATQFLEAPGDVRLGDRNDDGVPEVSIGRLPVRSPAEARALVAKLLSRAETQSGAWSRSALFVTDQDAGYSFTGAAQQLAGALPPGVQGRSFRLRAQGAALRQALQGGSLVVGYLGHGSQSAWGGADFTTTDAQGLTNGNRLPVLLALTCLNGFIHDPTQESLAQAWVRAPRGGAVAAFASGTLTYPGDQERLGAGFLRALGQGARLGDAERAARASVTDPDVRRSWILLGDPSQRVR